MNNDQDLKALMSSEVFRNYLSIELERESKAHLATDEQLKQAKRQAQEFKNAIEAFAEFEIKVREDEVLKQAFIDMRQKLLESPALRKQLGSKFANAIMMLNLEDSTF